MDKLFYYRKWKTSQGVFNKYNEEMIKKGTEVHNEESSRVGLYNS